MLLQITPISTKPQQNCGKWQLVQHSSLENCDELPKVENFKLTLSIFRLSKLHFLPNLHVIIFFECSRETRSEVLILKI
jgi:hypothetical protein